MVKYKIPLEKEHITYKDSNGNKLVGTTTVLGILAKPALYGWYFKMGKNGENPYKKKDAAANVGTIAHAMIMCHLRKWELDTSNLIPEAVGIAENCVLSYYEWEKNLNLEPILVEEPLISKIGYGGTIDLYAKANGGLWLIDFKTSSGIYEEMHYQVAAYKNLLEENNNPVDKTIILNIGKKEDDTFQVKTFNSLDNEFEIFRHCLEIYKLQNPMNGKNSFYDWTRKVSDKK